MQTTTKDTASLYAHYLASSLRTTSLLSYMDFVDLGIFLEVFTYRWQESSSLTADEEIKEGIAKLIELLWQYSPALSSTALYKQARLIKHLENEKNSEQLDALIHLLQQKLLQQKLKGREELK